ncbi:MAG TPA: TadE/TadG family type IV pilus assembly protein [Candidatus Limnocylindrales bacterium]|nr:TadE/TadG family type IV pilus assembly protein [Candidatus Limnocylindrales bacterium]
MRRRSDARGQGLIEFALVLPIIVLMFVAIFDFGRAVYALNTVANAAREGARVAAVDQVLTSPDCVESMPVEDPNNPHWSIRTCAVSAAQALGLPTSAVTVSYAAPPGINLSCAPTLHVGCIATVTVQYTWTAITPLIGGLIGPVSISSSSQMPIERVFP